MVIKTKEDWIELCKITVPKLPEYMAEHIGRGVVDPVKAEEALNADLAAENWPALYLKFQQIWQSLPDNPSMRRHPFFDLCDLCSEYWVFEES